MANSEAGLCNDAARALGGEYQVFLSFRGPDTRHGFTDFLYHDLINAGVRVFRDEDELHEGEVIGDNLLQAINNSILYIPIFSQNYASSKWCLRELALMIDNVSKSKGKKSIFPIFFDVEPEDVKLKTPLYNDALLEHKKKFPGKVNDWRKALEEVDEIKGWNVKKDRSQAEIVKSVVEKVLEKLEIKQKLVSENLVGLDDRVNDVTELLDVNHCDVRVITIYGMGGIGKTTVAKVVFNRLSSHFGKCCSFLEDIRESSSTEEGIVRLQKKLLSDIVGSRSVEQDMDSEKGMRRIGEALRTKKVLVVLDDVAEEQHIKNLTGNYSLRSGSRIIITTRDKTIPLDEGFNGEIRRYEMLKMDDALALQLFCRHAFGRDFPSDDYCGLSSEIVSSTGGLPLAVEVIGSSLKRRDKAIWEETLLGLKNLPEEKILMKLKISYDGLDKIQKQIFLDIACFFFNKKKTEAIYMWASCQFKPIRGIEVLTERCLIKILDKDKFWMHDQLIALGRQIVREESLGDLVKQSRLWIAEEALEIIKTQERKCEVQALEISTFSASIEITNEDFERLPNLRFLDLNGGTYAGDFARCRSNLKWFSWHSPLEKVFRADNLHFDRLVVCKLRAVDFKDDSKAWDLIKKARDLRVISLTKCNGITTIPDFSKCSGLERLTLAKCSSLKRVESFIRNLRSLIELKIEECWNFTYLPEEVGALVELKHFSLLGCRGFKELPSSIRNLTSLTELNLSDTIVRELPNSIGKLKSLRILRSPIHPSIGREHQDWQLPSGISMLVNLEELDLSGRDVTGEIPDVIGELSSLRILNLEFTRIHGIPKTINKLHHLQTLNLRWCDEIQELPELPTNLTCLFLQSKSLLLVPNLLNLTNLVELLLSDGPRTEEKSNIITGCNLRWIGRLSKVKKLDLNLSNVPAPPELAFLSHLEELELSRLDLKPLGQLPSSNWNWRNLSILEIYWCEVEDIPLDGLPRLEKLIVKGCKPLQRLSIPLELRKLSKVDVSCCRELVEIQVVGLLVSLEFLSVYECKSLTRISGLSYLKNLSSLRIENCRVLTDVEGLNELEPLNCLEVTGCPNIPDDYLDTLGCEANILSMLIYASVTNTLDGCLVDRRIFFKHSLKEILPDTSNFESKSHKRDDSEDDGDHYEDDEDGDSEDNEDDYEDDEDGDSEAAYQDDEDDDVQEVLQSFCCPPLVYFVAGYDVDEEGDGNDYNDNEDEEAKEEDGVEFDISNFDEVSYSTCVGQSETDGSSPIDDFQSERGNTECFEAVGNRRQMRDGRIGLHDSVDGGKTASKENRKKDKDEIGEPANPSDVVGSSRQTCEGVEHYERSCKATTEVEDQRDFSSVKRDKTVETDQVLAKTGRGSVTGYASNPGRDPRERGRGKDIAKSSRNSQGLRLGRDATSTLGKGTASNSGRDIASSSQSSATSSSGSARGSTSGKDTTLSSGRGITLSLGTGGGSSSRMDTTRMGIASSPGIGITSSSRSSATLSTERSRDSTSGKGTTVNSGRGMTLSLGTGRGSSSRVDTNKMRTASSSVRGIISSSRSSMTLSTGRGRGSTSGKGTTVRSGRGSTLSLGRGTTKLGTSLRLGTYKGSSSANAEPQTSRSREEQ